MTDRIYTAFISSTFKDLIEERRAVQETLLRAKCYPVGMELFPATDSGSWAIIERSIDACDFYVLVVGGRYGDINQDDEKKRSWTELEYDYALGKGKPVLAFLPSNPGAIPSEKTDQGVPGAAENLRRFCGRLREDRKHFREYANKDRLALEVFAAIDDAKQRPDVVGWVRADQTASPEMMAEFIALQKRLKELEEEEPMGLFSGLATLEEEIDLDKVYDLHLEAVSYATGETERTFRWECSLGGLMAYAVVPLRVGADTHEIANRWTIWCKRVAGVMGVYGAISEEVAEKVLIALELMGLVRSQIGEGSNLVWQFTKEGAKAALERVGAR